MAACAETPTKKKISWVVKSVSRGLGVYRSPTPTPTNEKIESSEPDTSVEASNEFGNYYSSYLWTFKNFSKCILAKNEEMTAPVFKFAGSKWTVGVNLYKISSSNNFTVVVGLDKTSSDITDGMVRWSLSLVDRYGVGRRMKEGTLCIAKAKSWEVFSFKKNSIIDESGMKFLPDDCLAIRLNLLVEDMFPCQKSWKKNRGFELLQSESCFMSLSNDMSDLLETGRDSDVTLKAGESLFQCHKLILSSRSEVFAKLFREMDAENSVVSIDDIELSDLKPLLEYIYSGIICPGLPIERIISIYKSADQYGIVSLKAWCMKQMVERLGTSNVLQILLLAQQYSDTHLKASAVDYLVFNERIFLTEEWRLFSSIGGNQTLALDILNGYIRKSLGPPYETEEEDATATACG